MDSLIWDSSFYFIEKLYKVLFTSSKEIIMTLLYYVNSIIMSFIKADPVGFQLGLSEEEGWGCCIVEPPLSPDYFNCMGNLG